MRLVPWLCLPLVATLTLTGCPKKTPQVSSSVSAETNAVSEASSESEALQSETANADQSASASTKPSQPLPPPPPPSRVVTARAVNTVQEKIVGEVDAELTQELRTFIQDKKRMPQSFSEFATIRLDSVPRPPQGKKWVIDAGSLEVKAVAGQ